MPLSIFSRRKKHTHALPYTPPSQLLQPPGLTSPQESNALLAAGLAFQNHNPNPQLSSSAAAAALKYAASQPPNPATVIGNIPTKRMKRGGYSSTSGSVSGGSGTGARRSGVQLERVGSNASLMSERRFRSSDGATRRSVGGDGGSLSSMGSWTKRKHWRGGSLDSGVGSYSGNYAYGHQVPPPVPEIPEIYNHRSHGHAHQRQINWQDNQHAPPRSNINARRRLNGTHMHHAATGMKNCATCHCSCHSSLPISSTYQQDEVEENYDRLSLDSIPAASKASRQRYSGEYPDNHMYNYNHNTYSDEEGESIILSSHSEAPRPLLLFKQPSTSLRGNPSRPRTTIASLEITSHTSPLPKNIFGSLRTSVTDKAPLPTPKGGVKRYPSAGVGVERSGSGGSGHENENNRRRGRRRGSGGSTSNNSGMQLPDSIQGIISPSPPARGRKQHHHRAASGHPPPVPALPTYLSMNLHGSPSLKSVIARRQLPYVSGDGIVEEEPPALKAARDAVGRKKVVTEDEKEKINSGSESDVKAGRSKYGVKTEGGRKVWVQLEGVEDKHIRPRGLGIFGDGVKVGRQGKLVVDHSESDEEIGHDCTRHADADGSVVLPEHHHRIDLEPSRTPPLTSIPKEQEREPVPRKEGSLKKLIQIPVNQKPISTKYKEASSGSSRGSSPEGEAEVDFHTPIAVATVWERGHYSAPNPLTKTTTRPPIPPVELPPKTTTETLPLPTLNILPSTPQAPEHHDRTATPSPTNESAKAQKHHLRVIPTREIPIAIHDPLPRKGIMKQSGVKRGGVSEGRGVQFSESASEIEVVAEYEEDEEDEEDEVTMGGGEKLKKKSGGFASWFRRGGGGKEKKKEAVQKKGKLSRRKDKDVAVLGPGTEVAMGVAVVSPPPSSSNSSGELLSHVTEGTVGNLSPVPEIKAPEPKPEPKPESDHAVDIQAKPPTESQQGFPGTFPEEWPQQPESSSSAFTTTPVGGSFAGVEITPLSSLYPSTSHRPPPTCDDTDGGSESGISIYEDALEEFLSSSPTPVVTVMEDIPRPKSPPSAGLPNMHDAAGPFSSSTTASSVHAPRSILSKSLRSATPTSISTSTTTTSTTSTPASASSTRKNRNRNRNRNLNNSRSPSPPTSSSPRGRYALPPAAITPRTKALMDERRRQIEARKAKGSTSHTQPHIRPMSESDTETEFQREEARGNGKRRGTGGLDPGMTLNSHSAEGKLLSRASLRTEPRAPRPPHPPPVETTPAKSSFLGFGGGKDKAKEEDKHRLRNLHGHHQKKFSSRFSRDSDSDSDDESPSGVRGGEFESRFAADSDSEAVESSEDAGGTAGEKEKEIAVRRLMEVIAKKKGVALTVDLDTPTSNTVVHEEEPEEEESEDELVTSNGTVGGEKNRKRKMGKRWGIFKKEAGYQGNSHRGRVEKREQLPVMKAGEMEDSVGGKGDEQEGEKDKGDGCGLGFSFFKNGVKFVFMFAKGVMHDDRNEYLNLMVMVLNDMRPLMLYRTYGFSKIPG
ncbi:hypothetical protein L211DRAFT_852239 [Terfezia boudieri ATCC MYA-4762]|uniref:Uncharacterized protein n=1 Tax=Terfezia boudieri ATCC MYA-4762 TaxID=1051890 RepID=A0A3N4LRA3_9PEZI|nr:hypothetical protein L211DRAFT_852239 [Terfezia boudieri ATCC MYA-4762]